MAGVVLRGCRNAYAKCATPRLIACGPTVTQGSNEELAVRYAAVDLESPITHYELLLTGGDHVIRPRSSVGMREEFVLAFDLREEETYCSVVRAHNAAGLWTETPTSCVRVDSTPPTFDKLWAEMKTGQLVAPEVRVPRTLLWSQLALVFR